MTAEHGLPPVENGLDYLQSVVEHLTGDSWPDRVTRAAYLAGGFQSVPMAQTLERLRDNAAVELPERCWTRFCCSPRRT